jgi:hypothetical protein
MDLLLLHPTYCGLFKFFFIYHMVCLIRYRNRTNAKHLPRKQNTVSGRHSTVTDVKFQSQCSCTFRLHTTVNVQQSFPNKFVQVFRTIRHHGLVFVTPWSTHSTSSSSGQETSCIVWNPKVHYHMSPTTNPFRVYIHCSIRTIPTCGLQVGPLDFH